MANPHHPRRGSLQFWPRKRAKRSYARVNAWPSTNDPKLLGFIGYKVGMSHLATSSIFPNSTKEQDGINYAVTVIECPPIKPYSLRFYKKTYDGIELISEFFTKKTDKELKRKIKPSKKEGSIPEDFDFLRLVVYTQPKLAGVGKKKPELIEIEVGGKDNAAKLEFAKGLFGTEIKISDVFKEGQQLDIHGVTKGKGFQGTVKRYGVKIRQHKSEKTKRGIGNLGAWTPKRVSYTVAQPGKMGYHLRTDFNKVCLKLGNDPKEVNQDGGFLHYGLVKSDYIILKGSVMGSAKRAITMVDATRPSTRKMQDPKISYISTSSKQGN